MTTEKPFIGFREIKRTDRKERVLQVWLEGKSFPDGEVIYPSDWYDVPRFHTLPDGTVVAGDEP